MISLALVPLAIKRLASRPGFTLLLILSTALTIGLVTCVPVFVDAVSLQILQEEIAHKMAAQDCPPFPVTIRAVPEYGTVMTMEEAVYDQAWLADLLPRAIGLPIRSTYTQNDGPPFFLIAPEGDPRYSESLVSPVQVTVVRDVDQHISIVEGAPYGTITDFSYLHVWLARAWAEELGIQVGDQFALEIPLERGVSPVPVQIVGIWEPIDPGDRSYWPDQPAKLLERRLLTTEAQYLTFISPVRPERTYAHTWCFVLDERQMSFSQAERYVWGLKDVARELEGRVPGGRIDLSPLSELQSGLKRKGTLSAILFSFSLPLLAMLLYLMISVAGMAARSQRQEVAVLASRGSGRGQILGLKLVETCTILALATPLGVGGGLLLARLMSYVKSFLVFAAAAELAAPTGLARQALISVHIQSVDWRLVAAAVALGAAAQVWPHAVAMHTTIVTYERWAARRSVVWSSARLLWTAMLVVVTVYAYHRLAAMGALSLIGLQPGEGALDPVPLLAPSLFLFTVSVVASQVFVLLVRPLALLGKALPSVAAYLGCTVLGREGEQYRAPIFLIVLCLSLGVFFASLGKSADQWLVDRRSYEVGADLTVDLDLALRSLGSDSFAPFRRPPARTPTPEGGDAGAGGEDTETGTGGDATTGSPQAETGAAGEGSIIQNKALLLPISEYDAVPGVAKAARVAEYRTTISGVRSVDLRLLGMDRLDFGRVVYFRPDYAEHSLGELMNRLGEQSDGLLIPAWLAQQLQVDRGDTLVLNARIDQDVYHTMPFTIVDTFTYFPTMYGQDLSTVVVGNLEYLQREMGGAVPYRVWVRVQPGAETESVLSGMRDLGVLPLVIGDRGLQIRADQRRLERVGMFGMLSFCFLASAALAGLGLLVHRFASLLGQRVRYAVWQAMGMGRGEILIAASVEYVLTLGYGIVLGAAGGVATSLLYVPLFRLTDQMDVIIPPFIPLVNWQAGVWIVVAIGMTFVLIEATTLVSVARLRIFEALRMGSRE